MIVRRSMRRNPLTYVIFAVIVLWLLIGFWFYN